MLAIARQRHAPPPSVPAVASLLLWLAACGAVEREDRADETLEFLAQSQAAAADLLPEGRPLTLQDCIDIALRQSLDVKSAEIEQRLAALDTEIAFAELLPKIDISFDWTGMTKPPVMRFGTQNVQGSDQYLRRAAVSAQQPIFTPQAWYLYLARQRGEDIAALLRQRTRQLITLNVTAGYFSCLSLESVQASQEQAVRQARALQNEVENFEAEGMATVSEREQAALLLLLRREDLAANRRALSRARAELLALMGVAPTAKLQLAGPPTRIDIEERTLNDDVLDALLLRPELHVADRTIEIRREEARIAIASLLPRILGIGGFSHSSDSYLMYPNVWSFGLSGVMRVFDGFSSIHEYHAARERERGDFVRREQTCMRVILEVIRARLSVDASRAQTTLARKQLDVAVLRLRAAEAMWQEGMLRASDRLTAIAQKQRAEANLTGATFQQQVATTTLLDVTGRAKS